VFELSLYINTQIYLGTSRRSISGALHLLTFPAHMLQISRASAFALCLSQVAVTLAVIAYYPPVHVQFFTCHPRIENGTLTLPESVLSVSNVGLSVPFLALSCLAVLFSTTTAGLVERGLLQQDNQYTYEIIHETGLWDAIFWAFCGGAHATVITVVISPADAYAVSISSLLVIFFLGRLCAPRVSQQLSMTQENFNLLGLFAGLLIVGYNIPDSHSGRSAALMVTCLLDYMLCVGHTWDVTPTMDCVTNCRLFWVCSASLCLAALYGAWHDHLLVDSGMN
jgi:hypothetical protein